MSDIQVSTDQLEAARDSVRQLCADLMCTKVNIRNLVESLPESWQSQAGDLLYDRLKTLCDELDKSVEYVNAYARFLNATSAAYDAIDMALKIKASMFS